MNGSTDDFTNDELALIPPPDPAEEAAAEQEANASNPGPTDSADPEPAQAPAPAPAAPAPAAAAPAPANPPADNRGNLSGALRAARASERRALEQLERERQARADLEQQLEEARQHLPASKRKGPAQELSDEDIDRLDRDFPEVAAAARMAKRALSALPASNAPAAAPAQPEFVPPRLPAELQEVVDSIPDLLGWQIDPNQDLFQRAQRMDVYLSSLEGWKDRPAAERLAEVVKRVKQDAPRAPSPSPSPNRADPAEVIAGLQRSAPSSLSDMPGGGGNEPPPPSNVARYQKMSDDDILADLARG